jgi:hypothetical protein
MPNAIAVRTHINASIRTFATRAQLTEKAIGLEISKMRGITEVFVGRYSVSVTKGEMFSWEEVEAQVGSVPTGTSGQHGGLGCRLLRLN